MTQANEPSTIVQPGEAVAKTAVQTKRSGCGVAILILLGLTIAGAIAGYVLGLWVYSFPKGPWTQLDLNQDKAVQIIGTDDYDYENNVYPKNMYLSTTSGIVYSCWMKYSNNRPAQRCNKAISNQISTKRYECQSEYNIAATPPPPGKVIDSLCYPTDMGGSSNIAILSDGSVWEWEHLGGEFGGLPDGLMGALVGSVVGFIAGIFAAIFWTIHRKRSNERKVQSES